MFQDSIVKAIVDGATSAGIDPAALVTVCEVETSGKPFEVDGVTPSFLYERHVAYREARKLGGEVLTSFVKAGLAIPKWSKSTQYKDEATSQLRLALIARARAINEDVANASASWGLGQTMGNVFEELGFDSPTHMVKYMVDGGLAAQIKVMVAEIKSKGLIKALNAHEWETFARRYNGPGYKANRYDEKLAASYNRWSRKLPTVVSRPLPPAHQMLTAKEIAALQKTLYGLGYPMVGRIDGVWGKNTVAALNAFQHYEGLPESGDLDDATKAALAVAKPVIQSDERIAATADDLRGKSRVVDAADGIHVAAKAKIATGIALLGGGGADQVGLLGQAQDAVDKVGQVRTLYETVHGWLEPILGNPTTIMIGIALIGVGFYVARFAKSVIEARVADHRSGAHNGGNT